MKTWWFKRRFLCCHIRVRQPEKARGREAEEYLAAMHIHEVMVGQQDTHNPHPQPARTPQGPQHLLTVIKS